MKRFIFVFLMICVKIAADTSDDDFDKAKVKYENSSPVFSQKSGMLRPGDHSFYFRTDDEWTGFSTCFLGYRYALTDYFNIAVEGGASILPHVYLANVLLHFKMYESPGKTFFSGVRARFGYKYQNHDLSYLQLGDRYLVILERHSLYFAADFTAALRFGRWKEHALYYTVYPKIEINLLKPERPYILFAPVNFGYEIRFGRYLDWSFAVESGYAFPVPWGSVPEGEWVNFPSLANVGVHYRFGNKPDYKKSK